MTWNPPDWTIGDRIRKAREEAGLTIDALAREAGVARQSIGPWEAGSRSPSPAALAQVVRALAPRLKVTEAQLLEWVRDSK